MGLNSVLNVKVLVGAFNQEKALEPIVKPMDRFTALVMNDEGKRHSSFQSAQNPHQQLLSISTSCEWPVAN